jgi:hypothetical protein
MKRVALCQLREVFTPQPPGRAPHGAGLRASGTTHLRAVAVSRRRDSASPGHPRTPDASRSQRSASLRASGTHHSLCASGAMAREGGRNMSGLA